MKFASLLCLICAVLFLALPQSHAADATSVEIWRGGDDGLTIHFSEALERAFANDTGFSLQHVHDPRNTKISIMSNVQPSSQGNRIRVSYSVEFSLDEKLLGSNKGACWEDAIEECAQIVLIDAKRVMKHEH